MARVSASVVIAGLTLLLACRAGAQAPNPFQMSKEQRDAYFAKINAASQKEWQRVVELLRITLPTNLPPPAEDRHRPTHTAQREGSSNWYDSSGNTYTRTAWGTWNNYDEANANPYPNLPDPLSLSGGGRVTDSNTWWKERRPQIIAGFDTSILGKVPVHVPSVHWVVIRTKDTTIGQIPAVVKTLHGKVDNSADTDITVVIQAELTMPAKAARPVPVVLEFGFIFPPGFTFPGMTPNPGPSWQEQVLRRGWAYVEYVPTSVQADNGAGLTEGIIGLTNKGQPRRPDDWGALRAWAWGASRVLDYLESDKSVDAHHVAIEGLSRYGKAVLVAMAYDQRFAVVCVGSSGKGGAALYRRNFGESMGNICSSGAFHWFAENLMKYVLTPSALPVDSHELIALCAPRPVFISCGSPEVEGRWVDDNGQFMAEVAAGPVYTLLGKINLRTSLMPPLGTSLDSGTLAFRQHEAGHTIGPNWPFFLDFAAKQFEQSGDTLHH